MYKISATKLKQHLNLEMPLQRSPGVSTIQRILRNTFGLGYKQSNMSKFRYRDPSYNEKRLFISRLMGQFLHDKVVIISVDETSIWSDSLKRKQWNFVPGTLKRPKV